MSLISHVVAGLRFRLFVLTALVCAPLVALTLRTAGQERRHQMASWRQRSQRMLQIAQREEEKAVGATRQLLLALAESSAVRTRNRRNCKRVLDELFASFPRYANLGVIGTNGDILASVLPLPEPPNQAAQLYFRRALETKAFALGEFPPDRPQLRPTVEFGCPVLDSTGETIAVVFASLDLRWFDRFSSDLLAQLPRGATWTEIAANGVVLAREPDPAPGSWVGRRLPESFLLTTLFDHPEGVLEARNPDDVDSIYAYGAMSSPLAGASVGTLLGIPKQALFSQADRTLHRNLTWLAVAAGLAFLLGWLASNLLILGPVDTLVKAAARVARGDLSARTGLTHTRDELGQITRAFDEMARALEKRQTDQQHTLQKVQALSQRLVDAQESERRHIARELHDEIGQTLTTAEMSLQAALRHPCEPAVEQRLKDGIQAVERVLDQVRDLSLKLRPSMLDDLGLEPALRWYTQRQAATAGLKAEFRADPLEERLDPLVETCCFRVAQEALTNVLRHARATATAVELTLREGFLHLRVIDDGIGFDIEACRMQARREASLGLLSMEERASLAGGGVEYRSEPGQGTEVHAWFPVKWKSSPPLAALSAQATIGAS